MIKQSIRLLAVVAAVAAGTFAAAGAAHADVRHPASGTCTVVTTVDQKDGAWYRTYTKYCDGQIKPVCSRTFQIITLNRWPYRLSVPVRTSGYYRCPVSDIAPRRIARLA